MHHVVSVSLAVVDGMIKMEWKAIKLYLISNTICLILWINPNTRRNRCWNGKRRQSV